MPTFEYECSTCQIEFEELLTQSDEVKQFSEEHPCPECHQMATRIKVSAVSFAFKAPAGQTAGSGVHGQSGVHDLDYPSVDKAVGRSAGKRWNSFNERKAKRDKVRKEAGTNAVTRVGDTVAPLDSGAASVRERAMNTFNTVKKSSDSE